MSSQTREQASRRIDLSRRRRVWVILVSTLLIGLMAPAIPQWKSSRPEYPSGISGLVRCFADCLWLGYGRYHAPIDKITIPVSQRLTVLVKPFRLDMRTSGGMGECASVVENGNGIVLAAWMMRDNRNGQTYKIYARRITAAGTSISPDFRVNTGVSSRLLAHHVCLRADSQGYFYLVWNAARTTGELVNGGAGIFMRVFGPGGQAEGPETQVSSEPSGSMPELECSDNGAAAVWSDHGRLFGRLLDHKGPSGHPVRLDDTPDDAVAEFPAIAQGSNGNWLIAWTDTRTGGRDVYCRLLDWQLRPIQAAVRVGSGPVPTKFFRLISVCSVRGSYCVLWVRPGDQCARWFRANGVPGGPAINTLPATAEVAGLARPDGTILTTNGRSLVVCQSGKRSDPVPLLQPPSHPNEASLAAGRDGVWVAWHDSLDERRIPALGDNLFVMAARIALKPPTWPQSHALQTEMSNK